MRAASFCEYFGEAAQEVKPQLPLWIYYTRVEERLPIPERAERLASYGLKARPKKDPGPRFRTVDWAAAFGCRR